MTYMSIKQFMDEDLSTISETLRDLTPEKSLGLIRKIVISDNKDDLKEILLNHFSEYAIHLFGLCIPDFGKYSMDLCPIMDSRTGKIGYMDLDFFIVIPPIYDSVNPFNKMYLAVCEVNKQLGVINNSGSWVIEPDYKEILVDRNCLTYTCNDGADIYSYELDMKDHIMSEPYELERNYILSDTVKPSTHRKLIISIEL